MKKPVFWIAGILVVVTFWLYWWLDEHGLYVGTETRPQIGILNGARVQGELISCRYFMVSGVETGSWGWVAGTDPATLLPDGTQPHVLDDCRFYWPWDVFVDPADER